MKKVVRLRKRFHYAGKYYSIMKKVWIVVVFDWKILAEGKEGLTQEKKEILEALKQISNPDSKEYRTLRARQNIIKQFKRIPTDHRVVGDVWYCQR